jgi:DNA-binding MarR family transcriptional regulator
VKPLHNSPEGEARALLLERLFELGVLLADSMDHGLAGQGLTRARAELMWRLRREGPQTQRALSRLLQCTPRNVTGLVDGLEASGFVTRGAHPTDRRATVVTLTRKGIASAARMEAGYATAAETLLGGIDESDLAVFGATLDEILARVREPAGSRAEPKAS